MSRSVVRVSRNGRLIGQYPPDQLASLWDTGQFRDTDVCTSDEVPEGAPLTEFLKKVSISKYAPVTPIEPSMQRVVTSSTSSSGRRQRQKKNKTPALAGWIAFLLSLSVSVGLVFWIFGLYGELARKTEKAADLEARLAAKDRDYQKLLFVSREITEPGVIRGSAILRNESGKRIAMPGIQVSLYNRKVIEQYIEERGHALAALPPGSTVDGAAFFSTDLPRPLNTTTTDASGRFEFKVPEPGEYVFFTSINSFSQGTQSTRLWFVSFNSEDPLNTVVEISDTNAVQQFVPSLMIAEGR